MEIKVGYCVAYDWPLLKYSLPLVYNHADRISMSIDKNRVSWTGQKYDFDQDAFRFFIKNTDPLLKIDLIEEDFYDPELSAMQNEVRQRNIMSGRMREGGWHIQLDCDEYFLDFGGFVNQLKTSNLSKWNKVNVCCPLLIMFKEVRGGYLIIIHSNPGKAEFVPVATTQPSYEYGRRNGYFNYLTGYYILHQSWARPPEEIKRKMANWGHVGDFNGEKFYGLWESANENNFRDLKNFHPMKPEAWAGLDFSPAASIGELILDLKNKDFKVNKTWLFLKNSKLVSKLMTLLPK